MHVEEFASLVEQAIEDRRMELWEVLDLRLTVKMSRRRNNVDNLDLFILKRSGVPLSGYVGIPSKFELSEPVENRKQSCLFE